MNPILNGYIDNCYEMYDEEKENNTPQEKIIEIKTPKLKKQKTFIMEDYIKLASFGKN